MKKMKLVPYALALSLSATISLTSCGNNNFTYSTNTEGEFIADGVIDYKLLKDYKLIELKLLNDERNIYIVNSASGAVGKTYFDIFTGSKIFATYDESQIQLINEYNLNDYLITYDEVKGSYSIEDIERIYNKIVEDYEFEKEKTLEK